mgnify:CR=1 FL=1
MNASKRGRAADITRPRCNVLAREAFDLESSTHDSQPGETELSRKVDQGVKKGAATRPAPLPHHPVGRPVHPALQPVHT